jgi:hypothetical protein
MHDVQPTEQPQLMVACNPLDRMISEVGPIGLTSIRPEANLRCSQLILRQSKYFQQSITIQGNPLLADCQVAGSTLADRPGLRSFLAQISYLVQTYIKGVLRTDFVQASSWTSFSGQKFPASQRRTASWDLDRNLETRRRFDHLSFDPAVGSQSEHIE